MHIQFNFVQQCIQISTRINSTSVHTYICVCFIQNVSSIRIYILINPRFNTVYIGLPGVTGIADDMIIFGKSELEHDRNLLQFLETTRKNGLVLNKSKLQFKKQEVHFFGYRWNSHGITPDPKKIDSILQMEFPKDKETMHSFLGLINFLNRYSPRLAELCAPLRSLILKDAHYNITEEH